MTPRPIICFVHIPKTAGSTVNHLLAKHLPNGQAQAHALIENSEALPKRIKKMDWLSAHLPYSRFRSAVMAATDRPRHIYSLLRTPSAQVMSHYNWLIEIFHRGSGFYEGHPQHIKKISQAIRNADNSDPRQVIGLLRTHSGLFLNTQARFVLPNAFKNAEGDDLIKALRRYRGIHVQDQLPALMKQMLEKDIDAEKRINSAIYHFDTAVFDTPEIREFLSRENALDERVYAQVAEGLPPRGRAARAAGVKRATLADS